MTFFYVNQLPTLTFLLSAVIAFATGTSWAIRWSTARRRRPSDGGGARADCGGGAYGHRPDARARGAKRLFTAVAGLNFLNAVALFIAGWYATTLLDAQPTGS